MPHTKGKMTMRVSPQQGWGQSFLVAIAWATFLAAVQAEESVTIYRDVWGVPNIYGESEEAVSYALGYAQAQDRPDQIFENYRSAIGRLAEVKGPEGVETDFYPHVFQFERWSKQHWEELSPKVRACMTAFQEGVRKYFDDHPDKKPASYLEIEPWMCVALGKAIIWGWPLGQAGEDLTAGGVEPPKIEYHGSNQMALAPSKTKQGVPIAIIDPHLGFYGMFRFYEARVYGGDLAVAGTTITGMPMGMLGLGHNEHISIAMTTGGPDTADIFRETLNPDNPSQYKVDGKWRDGTRRTIKIGVKTGDGAVDYVTRKILDTHHGPVIAEKDGFGYAAALTYTDQQLLADEMYRIFTAQNLDDVRQALAMAQIMPQNVMITTVDGEIYYQRTGRVPIRPENCDFNKPVDGSSSKTEWQGIHPTGDLVQILNPECGWMQNCNVSPRVMFRDSPLTENKYKPYLYMEPTYNGYRYGLHQRAKTTFQELDQVRQASVEDVFGIALSPQVAGVKPWQDRLRDVWKKAAAEVRQDEGLARFVQAILDWNGRAEKESTGILPYHYWKEQLGTFDREVGNRVAAPPNLLLTDEQVLQMVRDGRQAMMKDHGRVDAKYGDIYRVGRIGGKRTTPADGGSINGIATPRALSFGHKLEDGRQLMSGGQCALQVVIMTKPPQSWTASPLGQSDDPNSPHFDDQAIDLVGNRKLKSTYFKDKPALLKNLESTLELVYHP